MTTQYTVREARRDDPEEAARLARLWNASDVDWPGSGLLHGVPMTAEHMRKILRGQDLMALVADADGETVGHIGVRRRPGRKDVAQGATVIVRPDWQGKGCGKALILAVLNRLPEMGYRQHRRSTWSGNLKAIPLYKKTGDFWKPGTSVELLNFIPTALTLPIARDFFAGHAWQQSLRRELNIAPDEISWHGIRVYPYHFEAGDDLFIMVIDPQAEAPTAVETADVLIACYLGREEVVCGLPYTLTWEIVNKRDDGRPLRVELVAESPPGIGLSVAESFEVTDSRLLQRKLVVPPSKPGSLQPVIQSTFLIDGLPVVLSTGFRTAQPLEIDVQGVQPIPGKEDEVVVRLYNRLKVAVTGEVSFEPRPGLAFDRETSPFTIPAVSWGSSRFRLTAEEGAHTTLVRAVCRPRNDAGLGLTQPLETRAKPVTFRSAPLDGVYAWEDEEKATATIETPLFWVEAHVGNGAFSVHERLSGQRIVQVGPPEVPSFDRDPTAPPREHRLETAEGRVRLTLEIPSDTGLIVERTLTVTAAPFLRLDHRVHNTSGVASQPRLVLPGEILLHRGVTVPLAGEVVHEIVEGLGDFPLPAGQDLPTDPAAYSEGWTAREEHGLVAGLVWKTCGWIEGGSVRLDLPAIPPESFADADPLHLVVARGDWEVVRGLWQRLWQPGGVREEQPPAVHPVLSAGFEPGPLLVATEHTRASLVVRNRRLKPFAGRWELRATGLRSEPAGGELPGVTPQGPACRDLALACADLTPRVSPATILLSSEATFDERDAPIVVLGDAGRAVTVAEGSSLYEVDNGWLSFAVAPGHHGAMVSLRRSGRELLVSSFPEPRPFQWTAAWFGGVEPFLQQPGAVLHVRDSFTGEPAERLGARGLAWRGVRLSCQTRNPGTRWLAFSLEYLTTGGSNLVALVQRLTNLGGTPQEVPAGFIVFPAVSEETRVHYEVRRPGYEPGGETREREAVLRQRASRPPNFRFGDATWVAMGAESPLLTLISFPPPGEAGGWLVDRETAGLHTSLPFRLEPGETRERLAWLVLAENPRQAQAYRILSAIRELP